MPLYDYECPKGHRIEISCRIDDRPKKPVCKKCRSRMKQIITGVRIDIWKPIIIEHIEPNGQPRLFKTRRELRNRCNELGVDSSALL